MMRLSHFDYHLPHELIAQTPLVERDASRMLVLDRTKGTVEDRLFRNFSNYLQQGDVVVVNDSKVIPARLTGHRDTGGRVEILLLRSDNGQVWEALLKPGRRIKPGTQITFSGSVQATVGERLTDRKWQISFTSERPLEDFLAAHGTPPLPPYIKERRTFAARAEHLDRYQTIYAQRPGSVAAPTAGLHFTHEILENIARRGASLARITLHVGYGTFRPIETEEIEKHVMEPESFEISDDAAAMINEAERVVAVGTTVIRTIESAADNSGRLRSSTGLTDLYIYPGYRFKRVDVLLTNFHLPRSSLYILVCAFAGKDLIEMAYSHAIQNRYRFYSYGDCMLIL